MLSVEHDAIQFADKAAPTPAASEKQKAKQEERERERPKILVVDDEELIADTTTEILDDNGFRAFVAYSGQSALELAARIQPDYMLTDVLMPFMNGVELAIAVKKMFPSTRVLLFSGQAGISEILRRGRQQGYEFELISKPIHPEALIKLLQK